MQICLADHFPSPVTSPVSCDFLGAVNIDGVAAQPGDEVAFYDQDNVLCGLTIVKPNSSGLYGFVHVYGDDNSTSGIDEGAQQLLVSSQGGVSEAAAGLFCRRGIWQVGHADS